MNIVHDKPPNWDELVAAFPRAAELSRLYCAWGDRIYSIAGDTPPPEIMAHEYVHCARQKDDVRGWWRRYIDDPVFRLKEEVQGHKAEFARIALGVSRLPVGCHAVLHPLTGDQSGCPVTWGGRMRQACINIW